GDTGNGDRCHARGCADCRRDGTASLHRPQQSVLERQPECADGEFAGRDLPVRDEPLRGLAGPSLGRRVVDHHHGPVPKYRRPRPCFQEHLQAMSPATARQVMPLAPPNSLNTDAEPASRQKVLIRNVEFYYDTFKALKKITLPLYDKRVTAFIGPSGCGKSTLLRVLNRIYQLYPGQRATGEVIVDGENILSPGIDLNLLRARIGMVFQKPTPFPMSIYDNIAFGVRLYERLPNHELDDRVESALRRAALWDEVKDKLRRSGLGLS